MTFKMLLKKISDQDAWMNFVFPKLQALNPKAKVIFLLRGDIFLKYAHCQESQLYILAKAKWVEAQRE